MTWTKEDEQKIRSLILNDDIANVKIGIYLALNTLGMSIDELGLLVTIDDVVHITGQVNDQTLVELFAFGKVMACNYEGFESYSYKHYLTRYVERINELLNEI